jgi:hypothetical protein
MPTLNKTFVNSPSSAIDFIWSRTSHTKILIKACRSYEKKILYLVKAFEISNPIQKLIKFITL